MSRQGHTIYALSVALAFFGIQVVLADTIDEAGKHFTYIKDGKLEPYKKGQREIRVSEQLKIPKEAKVTDATTLNLELELVPKKPNIGKINNKDHITIRTDVNFKGSYGTASSADKPRVKQEVRFRPSKVTFQLDGGKREVIKGTFSTPKDANDRTKKGIREDVAGSRVTAQIDHWDLLIAKDKLANYLGGKFGKKKGSAKYVIEIETPYELYLNDTLVKKGSYTRSFTGNLYSEEEMDDNGKFNYRYSLGNSPRTGGTIVVPKKAKAKKPPQVGFLLPPTNGLAQPVPVNYAEQQPPAFSVTLNPLVRGRTIPRVLAGTRFDAALGIEVPISKSRKSMRGIGLGIGFRFPIGQTSAFANFSFVAFGDANKNTGAAAGGNNVAFTFFQPNPATGSTGILFGNTGQNVSLRTSGSWFEANAGVDLPLNLGNGASSPAAPASTRPTFATFVRLGAVVSGLHVDHQIHQYSTTFADHNMTTGLETEQYFVAPLVGAGVKADFGQVEIGITGSVAAGALFASGNMNQTVNCPFCPNPGDRAFSQTHNFNKTWLSVRSSLEAKISAQLSTHATLQISSRVDHYSKTAFISNPITPAQQPASMRTKSSTGLSVRASYMQRF